MLYNQNPSQANIITSRQTLSLVILCVSLISCTTPKKDSHDKIKQVQSEHKPLVADKKKPIIEEKVDQSDISNSTNKQNEQQLPQRQQKIDDANYSSEIKSAQTPEEKAAQLENKLDASLQEFDDMLLKKNEELSLPGHHEENPGGNGIAGQEQGEAKSSQYENNRENASAIGASGQSNEGSISSNKEFDNDDVVARQIREAAEKETDPELKKKLWEEYKKYKAENN